MLTDARPQRADDAPAHPRLVGLLVAAAIAGVIAAIEQLVFGSSVMLLSLLVAPYLGWCLGPDAAGRRRPGRTVLEMAAVSVLYGALLVSLAGQTYPVVAYDSPWDRVVDVVGIAIMGIIMFGLPAILLTSICALAWYAAVHRLSAIDRTGVSR